MAREGSMATSPCSNASMQHGNVSRVGSMSVYSNQLAHVSMQVTAYMQSPKLTCMLHLTDQSNKWQRKSSVLYIPVLLNTEQCFVTL